MKKAIELLKFPIFIGKYKKGNIYLHTGQYGLYLKYSKISIPIKDSDKEVNDIDLDYAMQVIEEKTSNEKRFKINDKIITIKKGPYGPYLTYTKGKKKINIKIPDSLPIDNISLEDCESLINRRKTSYKKNYKSKDMDA